VLGLEELKILKSHLNKMNKSWQEQQQEIEQRKQELKALYGF
jgi:peptidoglycan hydrolase CwlO-like protein